jgi:hypothetical protein
MPVLTPVPEIKQFSDIPPIGKGKGIGPEDFLWREVVALVNRVPLEKATWPQHAGNFEGLGGEGSDNHGQMASAAWYLAEPKTRIAGRTAAEFWLQCAAGQLGEWADAPGDAGLFQLSEPTSNDYDGYTVGGSWCTVWDRALATGDSETAAAMEKLVTTWAAMVTLMSTWPTADSFVVHRLKEDTTHKNPSRTLSRCSAGARSTSSHLHADPASLILTDLIRFPGKHPHPKGDPWDFWYLQITARRADWLPESIAADMRAVIADHDLAAADRVAALIPASARWKGNSGIEIRRWEDGTVVGIVAECLNGNTGWLPTSIVVPGQPAEHCWPWNEAKPKNLDACQVTEDGGQVIVRVEPDRLSPITLPPTPPARVYRFFLGGFEVNGQTGQTGKAGTQPVEKTKEPELIKETSRFPGPVDLGAVAGIVESLSLARRDKELQAQLVSELRSASPRPLPEIAADLERFGIGDAQVQAGPWREAIRMLRGS